MIKNNFILSESEKSRILTLHRLPNHKPSYRLSEQKIKVTWQGSEEKKAKDEKTTSDNLVSYASKGMFKRVDFSDENSVGNALTTLMDYIKESYRGYVFNYFYKSLLAADKKYPDNGYAGKASELLNAANTKTNDIKIKIKDDSYNTMSDPADDDLSLYDNLPIQTKEFSSAIIYKYKRLVGAESGVPDNSAEDKTKINNAQTNVINFITNASKGIQGEINDGLCIDILQFYLNRVIPKQYPLDKESLRGLKKGIAYCNTGIKYDPAREKGLFNKIKNKTSGNVYQSLKKKTKEQLYALQYRPDIFKVDITDPDNN